MTQQTLFATAGPPEPDLERTGGLHVAADETFAAATRLQLDETSWVDHVQCWLAGGLHVTVQLPATPTHTGRWNRPGLMSPPESPERPVQSDPKSQSRRPHDRKNAPPRTTASAPSA